MKISADYRMLALDALRGKWRTAVLTGIAASALGATIVSSSNSAVSNSNQAKDIHFNLFAQPNGGPLLAVFLVGIGLWAILQLIVGGAVQLGYAHFPICIAKTQYSFSTDPKLYGAVEGFEFHVQDIVMNAGAEMLVVIAGEIMRMPGLPKEPQALHIDIVNGEIEGLS